MSIDNNLQLTVAREKLRLIEDQLNELAARPVEIPLSREWTRRSLKKRANQVKEEITVYLSRQRSSAEA